MSHHKDMQLVELAGCSDPGPFIPGIFYDIGGISQGNLGNYRILTFADSTGQLSEHVTVYPDGAPNESWEGLFDYAICQLVYLKDQVSNEVWGVGNISGMGWFQNNVFGNKIQDNSTVIFGGPGNCTFNENVIEANSRIDISTAVGTFSQNRIKGSIITFPNGLGASFDTNSVENSTIIAPPNANWSGNYITSSNISLDIGGDVQGNTISASSIAGIVADQAPVFAKNSIFSSSLSFNVLTTNNPYFTFTGNVISGESVLNIDGTMDIRVVDNIIESESNVTMNSQSSRVLISQNRLHTATLAFTASFAFEMTRNIISENSQIRFIGAGIVNTPIRIATCTLANNSSIVIAGEQASCFMFDIDVVNASAIDIQGGPTTSFNSEFSRFEDGSQVNVRANARPDIKIYGSVVGERSLIDFAPNSGGILVLDSSKILGASYVNATSGFGLRFLNSTVDNNCEFRLEGGAQAFFNNSFVSESLFWSTPLNKSTLVSEGCNFFSSEIRVEEVSSDSTINLNRCSFKDNSRIVFFGPAINTTNITIGQTNFAASSAEFYDSSGAIINVANSEFTSGSKIVTATIDAPLKIESVSFSSQSTLGVANIPIGKTGLVEYVDASILSGVQITGPSTFSISEIFVRSGTFVNQGFNARKCWLANANTFLVASATNAQKVFYPGVLP